MPRWSPSSSKTGRSRWAPKPANNSPDRSKPMPTWNVRPRRAKAFRMSSFKLLVWPWENVRREKSVRGASCIEEEIPPDLLLHVIRCTQSICLDNTSFRPLRDVTSELFLSCRMNHLRKREERLDFILRCRCWFSPSISLRTESEGISVNCWTRVHRRTIFVSLRCVRRRSCSMRSTRNGRRSFMLYWKAIVCRRMIFSVSSFWSTWPRAIVCICIICLAFALFFSFWTSNIHSNRFSPSSSTLIQTINCTHQHWRVSIWIFFFSTFIRWSLESSFTASMPSMILNSIIPLSRTNWRRSFVPSRRYAKIRCEPIEVSAWNSFSSFSISWTIRRANFWLVSSTRMWRNLFNSPFNPACWSNEVNKPKSRARRRTSINGIPWRKPLDRLSSSTAESWHESCSLSSCSNRIGRKSSIDTPISFG